MARKMRYDHVLNFSYAYINLKNLFEGGLYKWDVAKKKAIAAARKIVYVAF
ncbi:hypothetical protein [Neobacillus drentensis]|uniref:hypothetical protein n=1 Tax=Neobacillus drentensis TaxID=220684 RepID=UPI0012F8B805|nr:hypothetical protein [Neobacillus drentensis]